MTICKAVVHSRAGQFFDGIDILDFCLFAENLVVLVQQKKKEYSGLEDWDGSSGLLDERRNKWGSQTLPIAVKKEWYETAKNVRAVLLKLAPVITQYIKIRIKH